MTFFHSDALLCHCGAAQHLGLIPLPAQGRWERGRGPSTASAPPTWGSSAPAAGKAGGATGTATADGFKVRHRHVRSYSTPIFHFKSSPILLLSTQHSTCQRAWPVGWTSKCKIRATAWPRRESAFTMKRRAPSLRPESERALPGRTAPGRDPTHKGRTENLHQTTWLGRGPATPFTLSTSKKFWYRMKNPTIKQECMDFLNRTMQKMTKTKQPKTGRLNPCKTGEE